MILNINTVLSAGPAGDLLSIWFCPAICETIALAYYLRSWILNLLNKYGCLLSPKFVTFLLKAQLFRKTFLIPSIWRKLPWTSTLKLDTFRFSTEFSLWVIDQYFFLVVGLYCFIPSALAGQAGSVFCMCCYLTPCVYGRWQLCH